MLIAVALCALLAVLALLLLAKVVSMHRAIDDIRAAFAERLAQDTNVGIDASSGDRHILRLAADLDAQLRSLRQLRLRYERGDRELKAAIAGIAHDLRTPLTAIVGHIELMEREPMTDEVRASLRIIQNRVDALRRLAEELLRYSVALSAPPDETLEIVSLNRAIEECIAEHYVLLRQRGITPVVDLPDAHVCVERPLSRAALSRILGNIVTNAALYGDGDLRIALDEAGTMTFRNRASRLDAVQVGRLFDRFYTVESGRGSGGTGLGLSIAKALTERMGGRIEARLEGEAFVVEVGWGAQKGER